MLRNILYNITYLYNLTTNRTSQDVPFQKLKVHIKQRLHRILSEGILPVMVSLLSYQSLSACKDVMFPENIQTHPWRVIRNSKKEGGQKGHIFKGIYEAELEFAEGLWGGEGLSQ